MRNKVYTLILCCLTVNLPAKEIHVSPSGADSNIGTIEKPYRTIQTAINSMVAGDVCIVHNGTYRENMTIKKTGSSLLPITIKAADGEGPVVSGLDLLQLDWKRGDREDVFVASYNNDNFEQLFLNGKPMLEARWPNVPKDHNGDWNFFSPEAWAAVDSTGNSYGIIKDEKLASTGWDAIGALAVLNVHHQFFVWSRTVDSHGLGCATFSYAKDLGGSVKDVDETGGHIKFGDDRYYLVGKREFLDASGEWYYDTTAKKLYVCLPKGLNPGSSLLEVKARNNGLTSSQTVNYITVDGLTFFGTALSFGKDMNGRSHHITFKNNKVLYSSCTEYFSMPQGSPKGQLSKNFPTMNVDSSQVCNNLFAYGVLNGLFINGYSNLIENNVFHDFNTNSSLNFPPLEVNRNWPAYAGKGGCATVRYNTLYNSGGILTQVGQGNNDVYLNDLYDAFRACWGGNKDVSALYTQSVYCAGTRLHHNWVHNAYAGTPPFEWNGGLGIRGDDNTAGLTVDHNVVWNVGSAGIMMKNSNNPTPEQANTVSNNTVFQHSSHNHIPSAIIVQTSNNANKYSLVDGNYAETIYGGWYAKPLGTVAQYANNVTGKCVEGMLENPVDYDFRPKLNMQNVGAYERDSEIYWIPGRRQPKASFPIVSNHATVSSDRDVCMFRVAYNAISHTVYFGTDKDKLELTCKLIGESNVVKLPQLYANKQYFWRVDARMPDGTTVEGDIWNFNVKN